MHPEVGDTRAGGNRGGMVKTADSWPASSVVPVLLGAWEREREQAVRSEAPLQKVPISSSSGINQPYDAQQLLPENFGHPPFPLKFIFSLGCSSEVNSSQAKAFLHH